jgi:hypothetical protein
MITFARYYTEAARHPSSCLANDCVERIHLLPFKKMKVVNVQSWRIRKRKRHGFDA